MEVHSYSYNQTLDNIDSDKAQLISKCPPGVIGSTKKTTN